MDAQSKAPSAPGPRPPRPFVKWAGGKRQLVDRLAARVPAAYNAYFEPFVGGGALLLHLAPEKARINDSNTQLINVYRCIRERPEQLLDRLAVLDRDRSRPAPDHYYAVRARYNEKLFLAENDLDQAAMFLFLNKHCYNGLYRVNGRGAFNVPCNNYQGPSCDPENIRQVSALLQKAVILNEDFEQACAPAAKGDFVFFDSPYAPLNQSSFDAYTSGGFSLEDHRRLANLFHDLSARGCHCLLTNHDTPLIRDLYRDFPIERVEVKRSINSDAAKRYGQEVIIRNFG